jgi:hypothetical protein
VDESMFLSFMKQKLPREDDRKLFEQLFEIYRRSGKETLAQYLKKMIAELEG